MKRALLIVAAMVITLVFTAGAWAEEPLANRLDRLEAKVARYEAILRYLVVDTNTINGLRGPHVIFRGANVHIQSGSNATNGLGNLIIGNNEMPGGGPSPTGPTNRTGSHNLVIGFGHSYSASGGFVAGTMNSISGQASSVSGGVRNRAIGQYSSVSGGEHNTASGQASSVSGGYNNKAVGQNSSVSGGQNSTASGSASSVSGGMGSTASGEFSSVSGGTGNTASGKGSSILGGSGKVAATLFQTVP